MQPGGLIKWLWKYSIDNLDARARQVSAQWGFYAIVDIVYLQNNTMCVMFCM